MDKRKQYLISLQNQNLSGKKIFDLMKKYDNDNPVQEAEVELDVNETNIDTNVGLNVGLSEVNIPGTLGYYQNLTNKNTDQEAEDISNDLVYGLSDDDFKTTLQIGNTPMYTLEEVQYNIDNKVEGFDIEGVETVSDYIEKMGNRVKINQNIRPGVENVYGGVLNPLDPVEIMQPFGYKNEDINNVLGVHTWFDDNAIARYGGGSRTVGKAHTLLADYWNETYGDEETQLTSFYKSNVGIERGATGVLENNGVVGYLDNEQLDGDIIDWMTGGVTPFSQKHGRDYLTSNDRLVSFDLEGGKSRKLAQYYSKENIKADNRVTFINVPNLRDFRINKNADLGESIFNIGNEKILEYSDNYLSDKELELKNLQNQYDSMPDESGGFPNTKKVELGKKIESMMGDGDYGNKLYDPSTGGLIDVKAKNAPLPAIELFNDAEEMASTDIDVLTNQLSDVYYGLNALASDIAGGYTIPEGEQSMNEYITENGFNWTDGSDAMFYTGAIGNNQSIINRPVNISDDQIKKLKEFAETGVLPKGLTYIPGESPLAIAFNDRLNTYTTVSKAIQLNRNLATANKGLGGQEFLEGVLDVGSNILGGDIGADNYFTNFEQAVTFKDFLEPNFNIDTDAINIATVKNFGQRNLGALPHFGEFLAQMYLNPLTARTGAITKLNSWTKSFAGGYNAFKNNPRAYRNFKRLMDANASGLKFEATSFTFDENYQFGSSYLFGTTMKGGEIAAAALSKGFFSNLTNSILSPKSQFLAKNPFYVGMTNVAARGRNLDVPRKIVNRVSAAGLGAGGYTFSSVLTSPDSYFQGLEESNISAAEAYGDEVFKMIVMNSFTKGLPGVMNVRNAVFNDVINLRSGGKSSRYSKDASKYFKIDNNIIENPTENSYKTIADATKKKIDDLLKRKREGKISKEDADKEFKEIKKNQRALTTQVSINTAYTAIEKERERGNLTPSDGDVSVIANKLKRGETLSASEAEMLDNIPKEVLYDYLKIQDGTPQAERFESIYAVNKDIINELNGGGPTVGYTGIGSKAKPYILFNSDNMGLYSVSNKLTPELYQKTYNFLFKKRQLNAEIKALENRETKDLSETEKIELKKELADKKEEAKRYVKEGDLYKISQSELTAESNRLLEDRASYGGGLKGGKSEIIDDVQEFQDIYNESGLNPKSVKNELAFIHPITGKSYINRTEANKIKSFTEGTHEDVHKITLDAFKGPDGKVTEEGIKIIDDVLAELSPEQLKILKNELNNPLVQRYDTSKPKNEWYDENLTVLSELIDKGRIQFSESFGESLEKMFPLFKKKLPNLDPEKVTGKQIFNMLKKLSTNREDFYKQGEQFSKDAADLKRKKYFDSLKENKNMTSEEMRKLMKEYDQKNPISVLTDAEFSAGAKVINPAGIEMFNTWKKGVSEGGNKIEIINDFYEKNPKFQEQFMSIAADALGFKAEKGTKTQQEFEDFVSNYRDGILRRFDPNLDENGNPQRNLTNFIYNNLKPKRQKFYETIDQESITGSVEEMREKGREIEDQTEEIVLTEDRGVDTDGLAKKPSETVIYKTEALENLNLSKEEGKTDNEIINEELAKITDEAFEGKEINSFKDTANVPDEIAQFYADMFGLKTVSGLNEKQRNFPKKDKDALVRIQQFLIDNSEADFARLPKTKDDFGKATGVYQTKLGKAMYDKNGNLIGTLKQYREILRGKPIIVNGVEFNAVGKDGKSKPIYRGDLQASIKFGMDMHMRNAILENQVDLQGKRLQLGGKFAASPKIRDVFKESLPEGAKLLEIGKETADSQRNFYLNELIDVFGENVKDFSTRGVLGNSGRFMNLDKLNRRGFSFVPYSAETLRADIKSGKIKGEDIIKANETIELLEAGEIRSLEELNTEIDLELSSRDNIQGLTPSEAANVKLALGSQTISKLDKNDSNYENIQKGKDIIFDKFWEIAQKNPGSIPNIIDIVYSSNSNINPFRNMATVEGIERGVDKDTDGRREEHVFQYGQFAQVFGSLLNSKDKKAWNSFKDWSKENYFQEVHSKETREILDGAVVSINKNTGEIIESWDRKNKPHPLLAQSIENAKKTGDWSKVLDPNIRKYNEYFTVNPNNLGRKVKQPDGSYKMVYDSERYGVVVPKEFYNDQIVINEQGELIRKVLLSEAELLPEDQRITREQAQEQINSFMKIEPSIEANFSKQKKEDFGAKDPNIKTVQENIVHLAQTDQSLKNARTLPQNKAIKSATVVDADKTIVNDKSKVDVEMPDGSKFKLTPEEFAQQSVLLEASGAKFDFKDFGTLTDPKTASWWKRFSEQHKQHGGKNMFVLSARPQSFAPSMHAWLKSMGKEIPIENITGLGNGTPIAKANWFVKKGAEGYNDFLFADDIAANSKAVQGVLDVLNINGPVQAKLSAKPKTFDEIFNSNLEVKTTEMGSKVGADWQISDARARTMGKRKNQNMFSNFFMGYSAEDFNGLLYATLPKGKKGDAMFEFYQTNLIDPFNNAERKIESAKVSAASDFKELKKKLTSLPKSMNTETGIGGFTFGDAARVAIWTQQGMKIPGLSKRDQNKLNKFVNKNADLATFVSEAVKIQKGKQYPKPTESWLAGTISTDVMGEINKVNRKEYLQEWKENVSIIFSEKNKNKLRYAFGDKYIESLEDTLRRMESGSNRPIGGSRNINNMLDWVNGSVGATMFLNTRSAALQTISSVNYLNWGDNNLINAGKAFANQKQYWKDFTKLFNSDYLINRREGLQINIAESEIADAAKEGGAKGAVSYLLNKGFIMTRGADSFAIASGGATFYRNRINSLMKQGMSKELAEQQAFQDFRKISEENQQSSSPMRISQQQASGGGRLILAFANTPMQYARIIKRSTQDLINQRGDWKTNVSKIAYYGAAQNLIFNGLQNALWTEAFDEEGDDDDKGARTFNGMADSLLSGLGFQGKAAIALKNSLMTIARENGKDSPEFKKAINDLFDFSPPVDSKIRKLTSAANTFSWERDRMQNQGFNLNNPAYLATAQVVSATTNIPADRALQKINNIRAIASNSSDNWQKVAMALGWSTWDVGLPYYGVEDKVEQTPEMIMKDRVIKMKKETSSKDQKEQLLELGLTRGEIKKLKYEENRIKKIIELQDKKEKSKTNNNEK
tara:strand:+ start:9513 stop:18854 length:9342 start_codon:yes stop_codon:yes gene_type:complete